MASKALVTLKSENVPGVGRERLKLLEAVARDFGFAGNDDLFVRHARQHGRTGILSEKARIRPFRCSARHHRDQLICCQKRARIIAGGYPLLPPLFGTGSKAMPSPDSTRRK
jgi:hypothetical protein